MYRLLICIILFLAFYSAACASLNQRIFPVAGCWEPVVVRSKTGADCRQYWGYQSKETQDVTIESGYDNYLVVQDNKLQSPVTLFAAGTESSNVFVTRIPCTAIPSSASWFLNGHTAHSHIGDNSHHCKNTLTARDVASPSKKKKDRKHHASKESDAAEQWELEHPVSHTFAHNTGVFESDKKCTQVAFSNIANHNCVRLPNSLSSGVPRDLSVALLDISLSAVTERPVSLAWSVGQECYSPESSVHEFWQTELRREIQEVPQMHFGLAQSSATQWPALGTDSFVPDDGTVYQSRDIGDALARAIQGAALSVSPAVMKLTLQTDGTSTLNGAVLRFCHEEEEDVQQVERNVALITPTYECTVVQQTMCKSWFGYTMEGVAAQHRPVSARNTFYTAPYDRGQPTRFLPGVHTHVFAVEWNCSAAATVSWAVDGSVTATPLGPACEIGCDGVIGGAVEADRCGVCGGDGTSCLPVPRENSAQGEFCDGDNARQYSVDFEEFPRELLSATAVQSLVLDRQHVKFISNAGEIRGLRLIDSNNPPQSRAALGTPGLTHGGPGHGSGSLSNSKAQDVVLAFDSPGSPGCFSARFDRPSVAHSLELLNVRAVCQGPGVAEADAPMGSKVSLSSNDNNKYIYLPWVTSSSEPPSNLSRCTSPEHCQSEKYFLKSGYTYSEKTEARRCSCDAHCNDWDECTVDVCVHGCCMHANIDGCCDSDEECRVHTTSRCFELFCCEQTHRCIRRRRKDCCQMDEDCPRTRPGSCIESFCDMENRCRMRGRTGCCRNHEDCEELFDPEEQCSVGRCEENTCVIRPKDCPSGLCVPSTGECVTASPSVPPSCSATPSLTVGASPSSTSSHTPFLSSSQTPSFGSSASPTSSQSPSFESSASTTPSHTPFLSSSQTPSVNSSRSSTSTHTPFLSSSQTPSFGSSVSTTPSHTPFLSSSQTPSFGSSSSSTATHTPFLSSSQTPSFGSSASTTPSHTPFLSSSQTPSFGSSSSSTATHTPFLSSSQTPSFGSSASTTSSHTPFLSVSQTPSVNSSSSSTTTHTPFLSSSQTPSFGSSASTTPSHTQIFSLSPSVNASRSPTASQTPSFESSASTTPSHTRVFSDSPSPSGEISRTFRPSGFTFPPSRSPPPRPSSPFPSDTPFPSDSSTPSSTPTSSPSEGASRSPTSTPDVSGSSTSSPGSSRSPTSTPDVSGSSTSSPGSSRFPTSTPDVSGSSTSSPGASRSPTSTPDVSGSSTSSPGASRSPTSTPDVSGSSTSSPGSSRSPTSTPDVSGSSTSSPGASRSPTSTPDVSGSSTSSPGASRSPTSTPDVSGSSTSSPGASRSPTSTPDVSGSSTSSPGSSRSPTSTPDVSGSSTSSPGASRSPTSTPDVSGSSTSSPGASRSPTSTPDVSGSATSSPGSSRSPTSTPDVSGSATSSLGSSRSPTSTPLGSESSTSSPGASRSPTSTQSASQSPEISRTVPPSRSTRPGGPSSSETPTATSSPSSTLPPSCLPGWGLGDDGHCHQGPPPFSLSHTEGPQPTLPILPSGHPTRSRDVRSISTINVGVSSTLTHH